MIVLDTDVVSELMLNKPDTTVLAWLDKQNASDLWLTSVIVTELLYGIARLPDGVRKRDLQSALVTTLEQDFNQRVLSFDLESASICASLMATCERAGRVSSIADAQIAAVCILHGATLATRNTKHFEQMGLALINPWTQS
jgi:toxin FitB